MGVAAVVAFAHSTGKEQEFYHLGTVGLFLSDGYSNVSGPVEASVKLVREGEGRTTELMDGVKPDIELDEHYDEALSPRPGNNGGL
ncbi:hypothetical protein PC123_g3112 [Phytophthora cactorum]|nr:hypothetical protein PC123_g3112 [Phytophthora cactorum]